MKKIIGAFLAVLLLVGLFAAQAETVWQEWQEIAPGTWQRAGSHPGMPESAFQQRGMGPTAAEVVMTEESETGFGEDGLPLWTIRHTLDADGLVLYYAVFNFDETGTLTNGSLTQRDADGAVVQVWSCIFRLHEDGGFNTQIDLYDKDDTLLSTVKAVYDKDGVFLGGEVLKGGASAFEAMDEPPAMDPIRDEWLRILEDKAAEDPA